MDEERGMKNQNSSKWTRKQKYKRQSPVRENMSKKSDETQSWSSNWNNYNENIKKEDNNQSDAADFEKLLQMPIVAGSHFLFRSERDWETKSNQICSNELSNFTNLFKLNVLLLSNGILTIPFYKQLEYDKAKFTKEAIAIMEYKACYQRERYKAVISNVKKDFQAQTFTGEMEIIQGKKNILTESSKNLLTYKSNNSQDENIDIETKSNNLLHMQTILGTRKIPSQPAESSKDLNNQKKSVISNNIAGNNENDTKGMQNWLDNFLEN